MLASAGLSDRVEVRPEKKGGNNSACDNVTFEQHLSRQLFAPCRARQENCVRSRIARQGLPKNGLKMRVSQHTCDERQDHIIQIHDTKQWAVHSWSHALRYAWTSGHLFCAGYLGYEHRRRFKFKCRHELIVTHCYMMFSRPGDRFMAPSQRGNRMWLD